MKWDFRHKTVQQLDNPESASQIGAKSILLAFGPPWYDPGIKTVAAGMIQNLSMNQQKQIMELFEMGSERRYWDDGVTRNQLQITRALFSGPSILKLAGTGLANVSMDPDTARMIGRHKSFNATDEKAASAGFNRQFWINLASDFFNNPLGVLIRFREHHGDGSSTSYGAVYLTNCKIAAHSINVQAGQNLVQENMQMMFEYPVPLAEGTLVKDHYTKRKEIMENLHGMAPEDFNQLVMDFDPEV